MSRQSPEWGKITSENPVTLRIGFYVDPTDKSEVDANELTAVDNFKLLYAGPRRNPELILDEESTDLLYLTKAADEYKNSVLHLNRKLNDNMWNSLILPVDLTWGQMKRTFGDAVKVAKLTALTEKSVQFVTVEPANDDSVMVKAFEPYIVYPPYTQVKSAAYTVEHFYTSAGEDNSQWLGTDYKPTSDQPSLPPAVAMALWYAKAQWRRHTTKTKTVRTRFSLAETTSTATTSCIRES